MFASILFSIAEVYFLEEFNRGWDKRWITSSRYTEGKLGGRFRISAGAYFVDRQMQRGLQALDDGRQYLISAKFQHCFNTSGKDMIFQYSVRNEQKVEFGQTKMKLFDVRFSPQTFSSKTPYEILFGPDFNDWDRHHLEFRITRNRTNYVSMKPVLAFQDQYTHVYSLIIFANQTYQIRKDNFTDIESHLEDDFGYCNPREIEDQNDVKPFDWVDDAEIDDPDEIPPAELAGVPHYIPDPAAVKPPRWNDEVDGEWKPPLITNPDYKTANWKPRRIPNPMYVGQWIPYNISNPDYNPDPGFGKPERLCWVGLDVDLDKSGTIWDNILVTDDFDVMDRMLEEKFFSIQDAERVMLKHQADEQERLDKSFKGRFKGGKSLPSDL